MMGKKQYLVPENELLEISIGPCILVSEFSISGNAGNDLSEDDDYKYSF